MFPSSRRSVLDYVVGTILSQNTTDVNSGRAFASLKAAFPTWEEVREAKASDVADSIRCGGLADTKVSAIAAVAVAVVIVIAVFASLLPVQTARIQELLQVVSSERGGECSLEHYEHMSNDDIKQDLARFKGIGPKTVACVLMFGLRRAEFPVDTHVVSEQRGIAMGWNGMELSGVE